MAVVSATSEGGKLALAGESRTAEPQRRGQAQCSAADLEVVALAELRPQAAEEQGLAAAAQPQQ